MAFFETFLWPFFMGNRSLRLSEELCMQASKYKVYLTSPVVMSYLLLTIEIEFYLDIHH